MQSVPQVSQAYVTLAIPRPTPLGTPGADAPLVRVVASAVVTGREAFDVVWYMDERSSREARVVEELGFGAPFTVGAA